MIKAVLVEPQKRTISFTPYWRNNRFLSSLYDLPVLNATNFKYYKKEKIEKIILTYAAFWNDWREIGDFIDLHKESKLYRILNEYNNTALSGYVSRIVKKRGGYIPITNFVNPKDDRTIQINLNTFIYDDLTMPDDRPKTHDILYYGMYRPDREVYFKRYFDDQMVVSTSKKNILLFKQKGIRCRFMKPFLWANPPLSLFRFSLYIEDVYTHSHYNYPANRFYEALMFGVVQLFDRNCLNTFRTAGYNINNYLINNKKTLINKIKEIKKDYNYHLSYQMKWRAKARSEKRQALSQFKEILNDGK